MAEEEKPASEDSASAPEEMTVVPLSKPIKVFLEDVSVLKMRKPTAADIISIGNPVQFDPFSDPPKVEHHPTRMNAMIARLSNVPTSSLARMEPQDWVSAAWAISPFFIPRAAAV